METKEKEVTWEEYQAACKVINTYAVQQKKKKLSPYEGCTKENIVTKEFLYGHRQIKVTGVWVSKDGKVPEDRNPDYIIRHEGLHEPGQWFSIEHGSAAYDTYEKAFKAVVNLLKRNKKIS